MSATAVLRDNAASAGRAPLIRVSAPRGGSHSFLRSAWSAAVDGVSLLAVVLAIPFVVLAVGLPVVLALQLVLWIARLL